ncbi:uncharacterized protein LOC119095232 [Pollicipes pollicipes]|uniref:uncharacterized protein LOC119095232 n=1 Tax=Pollicipes pollicipes TaxID=41117 RepID=UPI00188522CC|nr:uncharacterized protein LOC119095232 [Pollicipes pollicipes]
MQTIAKDMGRKVDSAPLALYNFFIELVRANLHVVVAMSPIGDAFRNRLRMFPSTHQTAAPIPSTADRGQMCARFTAWPEDALERVAHHFLRDVPDMDEDLRLGCVFVCQHFHESVRVMSQRYLAELNRHNYVTPTSYLELILAFKALLQRKRDDILTLRQRYVTGLEKLEFAASQVSVMQDELTSLQPQLIETSAQTEKLMIKIEQDTMEVEAKKEEQEQEQEQKQRQHQRQEQQAKQQQQQEQQEQEERPNQQEQQAQRQQQTQQEWQKQKEQQAQRPPAAEEQVHQPEQQRDQQAQQQLPAAVLDAFLALPYVHELSVAQHSRVVANSEKMLRLAFCAVRRCSGLPLPLPLSPDEPSCGVCDRLAGLSVQQLWLSGSVREGSDVRMVACGERADLDVMFQLGPAAVRTAMAEMADAEETPGSVAVKSSEDTKEEVAAGAECETGEEALRTPGNTREDSTAHAPPPEPLALTAEPAGRPGFLLLRHARRADCNLNLRTGALAMDVVACLTLPVGFPGSATERLEWRLSFSRHEYIVYRSMGPEQRRCLLALKYCKMALGDRASAVKSYYLKTALMWRWETAAEEVWSLGNMYDTLLQLLAYLEPLVRESFDAMLGGLFAPSADGRPPGMPVWSLLTLLFQVIRLAWLGGGLRMG